MTHVGTECELRLSGLSFGGSIDHGINCLGGLEQDELLDQENTTATPLDPAEINVVSLVVLQEQTVVGKKSYQPFTSLAIRIESTGTTEGAQIIELEIAGDSGTRRTYELVVDVSQYANCIK